MCWTTLCYTKTDWAEERLTSSTCCYLTLLPVEGFGIGDAPARHNGNVPVSVPDASASTNSPWLGSGGVYWKPLSVRVITMLPAQQRLVERPRAMALERCPSDGAGEPTSWQWTDSCVQAMCASGAAARTPSMISGRGLAVRPLVPMEKITMRGLTAEVSERANSTGFIAPGRPP